MASTYYCLSSLTFPSLHQSTLSRIYKPSHRMQTWKANVVESWLPLKDLHHSPSKNVHYCTQFEYHVYNNGIHLQLRSYTSQSQQAIVFVGNYFHFLQSIQCQWNFLIRSFKTCQSNPFHSDYQLCALIPRNWFNPSILHYNNNQHFPSMHDYLSIFYFIFSCNRDPRFLNP